MAAFLAFTIATKLLQACFRLSPHSVQTRFPELVDMRTASVIEREHSRFKGSSKAAPGEYRGSKVEQKGTTGGRAMLQRIGYEGTQYYSEASDLGSCLLRYPRYRTGVRNSALLPPSRFLPQIRGSDDWPPQDREVFKVPPTS